MPATTRSIGPNMGAASAPVKYSPGTTGLEGTGQERSLRAGHAAHRPTHQRRKEGQSIHVEPVTGCGQHMVDGQFGRRAALAVEAQVCIGPAQARQFDAARQAQGYYVFDALTQPSPARGVQRAVK
ncbi:hypothetical protein ACFVW1_29250 [Streptomyces olivochromogenes]|uniref:hypothetical protein n=1 Tax=Streptomyces olivochromogenes TaxID=1963 RepID=UPI0036D78D6D